MPFPRYQRISGEPYRVCERFMQMRGSVAGCVKAPFWKAQLERCMDLDGLRGSLSRDIENRRIYQWVPEFPFQLRKPRRRRPPPDNRPPKELKLAPPPLADLIALREAA